MEAKEIDLALWNALGSPHGRELRADLYWKMIATANTRATNKQRQSVYALETSFDRLAFSRISPL